MTVKMKFDPVQLVIQVCNDLFPDMDCVIEWASNLHDEYGAYGVTEFEETPVRVAVDVNTPMLHVVEILAHELAHVASGFEAEHGEKWECAFDKIHAEYARRVDERLTWK